MVQQELEVPMPPISIFVTSPDTHSERRLDSSLTIQQLKDKLVPITGIQPQYQILNLYRSSEASQVLAILNDESRTLGEYGVEEWMCIKVENVDPASRPGEYTDTEAVDKFELTKEEYEGRQDTVLAHLRANKLGRFAPTPTAIAHPLPPPSMIPADMTVGVRCEVSAGEEGLTRRGTVRFVGKAELGKGGVWVGVELDEPVGKGDGEVDGKCYFSCAPRHAVFVRPDKVTIGDFLEEDLMGDDDDEI